MDAIRAQELERLQTCVATARDAALAGDVLRGYSLLLRGFFLAERALDYRWTPELFACWRAAIDGYCEEFDPQTDDQGPAAAHAPAQDAAARECASGAYANY